MKFFRGSLARKAFAAAAGITVAASALVIVPTSAAFAAVGPCWASYASTSSSSGRVVGTGGLTCNEAKNGYATTMRVEIFHNYDNLPDPSVAYNTWNLTGRLYEQRKSVQRCDQSTTADYYTKTSSGWDSKTSGNKKISTCSGTGS